MSEECFFSEEGANVCGYEQEAAKRLSAELMAASVEMGEAKRKAETKPASMASADIKIETLVSWIFYHRDAGECFCFEDGIDAVKKEEILWKLRNIRRLERVFINEIV